MKPATRFAWLALLALFAALCLGGCGAAGSHDPGPLLAAPRLASIRSSLGGTVHSSLASPLGATSGVPTVVAQSVSFTGQTAGAAATLPSWLAGARASVRYVQTSASTLASSTVASGSLAIGQPADTTTRGLLVERGTTNLLTTPNTLSSWLVYSTITVTGGITGPDGTADAYHVVATNPGTLYQTPSGNLTYGTTYQASFWAKAAGSPAYDGYIYLSGVKTVFATGSALLSSSWARYVYPYTAGSTNSGWQFSVADSQSGIAALDLDAGYVQLETQPYGTTYTGTTPRAGERLYSSTASSVVYGGRLRAQFAFTPTWSTGQLFAGQAQDSSPNRRFWTLDASNFCELDGTHIQVRCEVGGTPAVFPLVISWNAGDHVTIRLDAGSGVPVGTIAINGGTVTSLGVVTTTHPYLRTDGGASIDWCCDATSGTPVSQVDAYVQSITLYKSATPAPPTTFFASVAGGGSGLTSASPTTLSGAQTLAQASPGATVLLAAGTYRLGSTFALAAVDNGTTYQTMPRQTAILSGHTLLTGSWSQVGSSSIWQLASVSGPIEQLFVNGVRATRASNAIATPSTWAISGTGFTANAGDAAIIDAFARTTDTVVVWETAFRYGETPLSAVAGTALTAVSTAFAEMTSGAGPTNLQLARYENAYELLASAGQWYWNAGSGVLSYYARTGDAMGSSPIVELGALDAVVTVGGSLSAPATGIALRGLTIEGSGSTSAAAPSVHPGYASMQAGVAGTSGATGGTSITGPYYLQPAAVRVSAANHITFAGCTMRRFAAAALSMLNGAQSNLVEGCTISDVQGVGVIDGDVQPANAAPTDARTEVNNNTYRRNAILNTGMRFADSPGMFFGYGAGTVVDHNTIARTGWSGMQVGWGWGSTGNVLALIPSPASVVDGRVITGNNVTNNGAGFPPGTDSGAIYTNGPCGSACTMSGNYGEALHGSGVWYLDNGSSHWSVTGNVVGPSTFAGYWLQVQHAAPIATLNTITGNFESAASGIVAGTPGSNTVSGNTASISGSTALAITATAGMRVSGAPTNDNALLGALAVAGLVVAAQRRARKAA